MRGKLVDRVVSEDAWKVSGCWSLRLQIRAVRANPWREIGDLVDHT